LPALAYPDYAPPVVESERNDELRDELIQRLRLHFGSDPYCYIWGDLAMYYVKNNPRKWVAPDVFIVRGVPAKPPRRVYFTWEEGKFPDFVLELVSESTVRRDLGFKRRLYAQLGVREYFLFDLQQGIMIPTLQGFRLAASDDGGEPTYQPIPDEPSGGLYSEVLGLELRGHRRSEDGQWWLFLWDPTAQRWLPTPEEAAIVRAEAAEAEVARLRALLEKQ
jgi:Uma2 family endonuclease